MGHLSARPACRASGHPLRLSLGLAAAVARHQMSRSARTLLGVALPLLAIVIFVLLLAFSLMRLSDIERDMRIEATQNMLWVISRAHVSSLQLSDTAAERAMGHVDRAQMELRYNIFLSRLALLDDGPQRRRMVELGFSDALDALRGHLPELGSLVVEAEQENLARIRAILMPYDTALGQAA